MELWANVCIWFGLAFLASLISLKIGLSVALVELVVGIAAGNWFHPVVTDWVSFLASVGAVVLTFLAGAELESKVLKQYWKESIILGIIGCAAPFGLGLAAAHGLLGWDLRASQIAGIALSTTSVAVVYAVMVETGLNETPVGKLILAACFINDLGTVILLGLIFTHFGAWFYGFAAVMVLVLPVLPRITRWLLKRMNSHPSEPEVRYLLLLLFGAGLLASKGGSEAVLPAYLIGMVLADTFLQSKELVRRLRASTFAFLTPFYFLKAGSLVSLKAVWISIGAVLVLFVAKSAAKFLGLWPAGRFLGLRSKVNFYNTFMMSTGLTFGTISALYGLKNGIITREQYSVLVVVVILTAIIPTLIAQRFFEPKGDERLQFMLERKESKGRKP